MPRILTHSEALQLHRPSYGVQPFEAIDEAMLNDLASSEEKWLLLSGIGRAYYACVVGKVSHLFPCEREDGPLFSFRCCDVNGRRYTGYVYGHFTDIIPVE